MFCLLLIKLRLHQSCSQVAARHRVLGYIELLLFFYNIRYLARVVHSAALLLFQRIDFQIVELDDRELQNMECLMICSRF